MVSGIQAVIRCNWQSFRKEYSCTPTIKTKAADRYLRPSHFHSIPIIMRYFSRTQPFDIPYSYIRRQISVIKGCKVDLQHEHPENQAVGNASTNSNKAMVVHSRRAPRINLLETNEIPSLRWLRLAINRVLRSTIPSRSALRIISNTIHRFTTKAETVTPVIKLQQWKCWIHADAAMEDILQTLVYINVRDENDTRENEITYKCIDKYKNNDERQTGRQ